MTTPPPSADSAGQVTRKPRLVVVAVLGLLVAGCSGGSGPVPDPEPTAAPASSAAHRVEPEDRVLRSDEEPVDPDPVPINRWEQVGEDELLLYVTSGPPECEGAAVDLSEAEDEIRVGVSVGVRASRGEMACAAVAVESVVEVALESPVGDREVVDTNAGS